MRGGLIMFKFKKLISAVLTLAMVCSLSIPAFAQTSDIDETSLAQKYTVDDIKALEPYVSAVDGHFTFDVEQAKADNVDTELIEGQVQYFDFLNCRADRGEITIEEDLGIINNNTSVIHATHWPSCGGGINTSVTEYWWGYSRYACDCETQRISADLNSAASVAAGIAVVTAYFGAIPAIPPGLDSAYFWLLASRLDANNHGYGVYIEMTWVLVFDITPQ